MVGKVQVDMAHQEVVIDMIKTVLEGLTILPNAPKTEGETVAPVVQLADGLVLSDRDFESSTLLVGSVGSGKSVLLSDIMKPVLKTAEENKENVIIFCAKRELLKYKRPGDIVVSVDTKDPEGCWNMFLEMKASKNPELTARDIAKALTLDQRSKEQPFFENACNDIVFNTIMNMHEDGCKKNITYTNWDFADFLNNVKVLGDEDDITWSKLAKLRPERFGHIDDYFGDGLGQGYGIASEIRTLLHSCFWGSFASDCGKFSAIEALKEGGKRIFLLYDFANSSEASVKILSTILNLLMKHSVDENNRRRTWFFLDEASQLPPTCIADCMSLGREQGFRLFMVLQSAELITRHYSKQDAKTILSLFPNLICLRVQDSFSRSLLADRYGKNLTLYSYTAPMQKNAQHAEFRPVVSDMDFSLLKNKGDAICSIPSLSESPFWYHGYRKELEK